jgi:hypothetical protein
LDCLSGNEHGANVARHMNHDSLATRAVASDLPWWRTVTREQWHVLAAAKFGWMLDAMDFMLYAMALGQLRTYFQFDDATADSSAPPR